MLGWIVSLSHQPLITRSSTEGRAPYPHAGGPSHLEQHLEVWMHDMAAALLTGAWVKMCGLGLLRCQHLEVWGRVQDGVVY